MKIGQKVKIKTIAHNGKVLRPMKHLIGKRGKVIEVLPKEDMFDCQIKVNNITLCMKKDELQWLK